MKIFINPISGLKRRRRCKPKIGFDYVEGKQSVPSMINKDG
jgi:hypothetical protein